MVSLTSFSAITVFLHIISNYLYASDPVTRREVAWNADSNQT